MSSNLTSLTSLKKITMLEFLRELYEFITKPSAPKKQLRGLASERWYLQRNIERTNKKIDSIYEECIQIGICPCCVSAFCGGTSGKYSMLIAKNERRQARLDYINKKIGPCDDGCKSE